MDDRSEMLKTNKRKKKKIKKGKGGKKNSFENLFSVCLSAVFKFSKSLILPL